MNEGPFVLNNRFVVDASLGSVSDRQTQKTTRIEPRLMNLLCLLADNNEKVVSRALITKQVWDDYGNADEGLTQAISYLRKVLADDDKTLIETVPKKGYILHAAISAMPAEEKNAEELKYVPGANRQKYLLIAALAFILLVVAWFVFRSMSQKSGNRDMISDGPPPGVVDTSHKVNNPDKRPDTVKKVQPDADKVR
ncbi:MAG TPA: winged helix-turn-helix domain-containing protein [Mucilaginibacter sp.]|jgi:DNA-binding winged helix-turn-helix (wHTH) protein|nr:winged helix-turn-helix domain-containing protein [Mucilaginibacter sp.]